MIAANKRFTDKVDCKYDLENIPLNTICINPTTEIIQSHNAAKESGEATLWGQGPNIPLIGDFVKIKFNELGTGYVESYFVEHGWLGVCVVLDKVPDWKKKNQADDPRRMEVALVFGIEIELVSDGK